LKKGLAACTPQKLFEFYAGGSSPLGEKSKKVFCGAFFQNSDRFVAFLI
jgi:hypothetical protein